MNTIHYVAAALKAGPVTANELLAITRAPLSSLNRALRAMEKMGAARRSGSRPAIWELTGVPLAQTEWRGGKKVVPVPSRVSIPTLVELFAFLER
ncbi:MAG TPA: hypothetical protein PKV98_18940 [Burkholderiaceae bacterium]|nr:hypothetical protein [Burkholderiaceae bacterium]